MVDGNLVVCLSVYLGSSVAACTLSLADGDGSSFLVVALLVADGSSRIFVGGELTASTAGNASNGYAIGFKIASKYKWHMVCVFVFSRVDNCVAIRDKGFMSSKLMGFASTNANFPLSIGFGVGLLLSVIRLQCRESIKRKLTKRFGEKRKKEEALFEEEHEIRRKEAEAVSFGNKKTPRKFKFNCY
ncbi:hypothetical protein Tco_0568537 [Tanacetum coccineum]